MEFLRQKSVSFTEMGVLSADGSLYAVVDSCDCPAVPRKALELGELRAVSLYRGSAEEQYWDTAPYLLSVGPDTLTWMRDELWGSPWGIFAASRADLTALRQQFRRYLWVLSPRNEKWLFRFYDPRVLKIFLSTCAEADLHSFFGLVVAFGISGSKDEKLTFYQKADASKVQDKERKHVATAPLRISQAQLGAFQVLTDQCFSENLVEYLRRNNPELVGDLTNDVLRQRIDFGLARARSYGLSEEYTLTAFVGTMFAVAPNFDEQPQIHRVLSNPTMLPDRRMDALWESTSDEDWEEAERNLDSGAWSRLPGVSPKW